VFLLAGTSRKRKIKATTQDKEAPKEIEEEEREVHHSPQRYFSPPRAPELEEVPSSTKTIAKRGRMLHFPSPTLLLDKSVGVDTN
jgi:hypothetical protein